MDFVLDFVLELFLEKCAKTANYYTTNVQFIVFLKNKINNV